MKTQENKPITTAQIKKIHTLLNQQGLMHDKKHIIKSVAGSLSRRNVESVKDLTLSEARYLIGLLEKGDMANLNNAILYENEYFEMRKNVFRAIYRLAWDMDIIYGETTDDYHMNVAKLNMFCRGRGTVKKNITDMDLYELRKTQRQFEAMYSKHKNKSKIEA